MAEIELLWEWSLRRLGGDPSRLPWEAVAAHYDTGGRAYHTVGHAERVMREARELASAEGLDDLSAAVAVVAAGYHDAVHRAGRGGDEDASARLAEAELRAVGVPAEVARSVAEAVRATRDHRPRTPAEQVLVDADLAVLGDEPDSYARYVEAVRREYPGLTDREFAAGRLEVLERLAARDPLYATATQRRRRGGRARDNLAAEITDRRRELAGPGEADGAA